MKERGGWWYKWEGHHIWLDGFGSQVLMQMEVTHTKIFDNNDGVKFSEKWGCFGRPDGITMAKFPFTIHYKVDQNGFSNLFIIVLPIVFCALFLHSFSFSTSMVDQSKSWNTTICSSFHIYNSSFCNPHSICDFEIQTKSLSLNQRSMCFISPTHHLAIYTYKHLNMRATSGWRSKPCNENGRPNPTLPYGFDPSLSTPLCIRYTTFKPCLVSFSVHLNKFLYSQELQLWSILVKIFQLPKLHVRYVYMYY